MKSKKQKRGKKTTWYNPLVEMQINFYFAMITLGRTEIGVILKRRQTLYLAWIVPRACELQASVFLIHYSHLKFFYRDE